jgi:hypothetical protein
MVQKQYPDEKRPFALGGFVEFSDLGRGQGLKNAPPQISLVGAP